MSDHIAIEELADASAGLLDDTRHGQVQVHVASCAECQQSWDALADVSELLSGLPVPVMPPDVAQRLDETLKAEQRRVAFSAGGHHLGGAAAAPASLGGSLLEAPRSSDVLGTGQLAGGRLTGRAAAGSLATGRVRPRGPRWVVGALAACVAAAAVGFGGYVLSASAGLNEPSTAAPAVVSTARLAAQAGSLLRGADLSPHRFSQAWQCARDVTDGRITAITNAVVDGQPALLVYTRSDHVEQVTVVTGCADGRPAAGPSTRLPR